MKKVFLTLVLGFVFTSALNASCFSEAREWAGGLKDEYGLTWVEYANLVNQATALCEAQ